VYWRYHAKLEVYEGTMRKDACKISAANKTAMVINDVLRLSANEIWISDAAHDLNGKLLWGRKDGVPLKNRKVRYFTGWSYVNRAGPAANDSDTAFASRRDLLIHNEGGRLALLADDGAPTGYLIELAQLTYQETKTPIMKLALIEASTNKSLGYIWTSTDATRIGMNWRWIQVGLTERATP
jgi:hypothetical protein